MKGERVSRTRSAISLALWALAVALWVPAQGLAQEAAADAPQEESAEAALAEEEEAPPPVPPLVADAQRLVAHLDAVEAKVRALQAQARAAEGEDRLVLKKQTMEAKLEFLAVMGRVVDNLGHLTCVTGGLGRYSGCSTDAQQQKPQQPRQP
jgi:hypothetical protein